MLDGHDKRGPRYVLPWPGKGKVEAAVAARFNVNPFSIGDRVMYKRDFLAAARITDPTAWCVWARGRVLDINGDFCRVMWSDAPAQNVCCSSLCLESSVTHTEPVGNRTHTKKGK